MAIRLDTKYCTMNTLYTEKTWKKYLNFYYIIAHAFVNFYSTECIVVSTKMLPNTSEVILKHMSWLDFCWDTR